MRCDFCLFVCFNIFFFLQILYQSMRIHCADARVKFFIRIRKWGVWGVDFPPGKNRRVTTGSTVCIFSMPLTNGNGQLSIPRVSRNVLIKRTILAWKLPSFENVYAVVLLDLLLSRGLFLREWVAAWQRGRVVINQRVVHEIRRSGHLLDLFSVVPSSNLRPRL